MCALVTGVQTCALPILFAAGLTIALPVGFVLILVQMIMGVIGRSAPAMNLFAVGLPATLLAGVVLLGMATPVMADTLARFLSDALDMARLIAAGRSMAARPDRDTHTDTPTRKTIGRKAWRERGGW